MEVDIKKIWLQPGWLVLEHVEIETKTQGGLIINTSKSSRLKAGRILKISDDIKELKIGDTVMYDNNFASDVTLPTKEGMTDFIFAKFEFIITRL